MFGAEFEQDGPKRRRDVRRTGLALDADVLGAAESRLGRAVCKVVDLSATGARLQTYLTLRPGAWITLIIPGCDLISAQVVWSREFVAGCQFKRPLPKTLVDRFASPGAG